VRPEPQDVGAGIYVRIFVGLGGEEWLDGDVPRDNLLSLRYVNGALVEDGTPRTFFPHRPPGAAVGAASGVTPGGVS
jgi:hypothetical protein